jgi:hypothetical protein
VTTESLLKRQATRKGLTGRAWERYVYGTIARWQKAARMAKEAKSTPASSPTHNETTEV